MQYNEFVIKMFATTAPLFNLLKCKRVRIDKNQILYFYMGNFWLADLLSNNDLKLH